MLYANSHVNQLGYWRVGGKACAFADSERHLGHILKVDSQWLAWDGTRLGESGIGFRLIGAFTDISSARIAVEFASIGMPALKGRAAVA